jgi:gas vesicle protein
MNKNPQLNDGTGGAFSSAATGFVLGAVVGAGIALLLAPETGKETRRRLTDAGTRLRDVARSRIDQALDTAGDLKQDATSALKAGREAFENGQMSHEPRSRTELKV